MSSSSVPSAIVAADSKAATGVQALDVYLFLSNVVAHFSAELYDATISFLSASELVDLQLCFLQEGGQLKARSSANDHPLQQALYSRLFRKLPENETFHEEQRGLRLLLGHVAVRRAIDGLEAKRKGVSPQESDLVANQAKNSQLASEVLSIALEERKREARDKKSPPFQPFLESALWQANALIGQADLAEQRLRQYIAGIRTVAGCFKIKTITAEIDLVGHVAAQTERPDEARELNQACSKKIDGMARPRKAELHLCLGIIVDRHPWLHSG